jgi:hypothetical protein
MGQEHDSRASDPRPMPTSAAPRTVAPGMEVGSNAPTQPQPVQQAQVPQAQALPPQQTASSAQPGFDF